MKHNTHIYLAKKAIEFLYDGCENLYQIDNNKVNSTKKRKLRAEAKILQRLLQYHENSVFEACWAPDDIINDKSVYHIFKLFTHREFTDAKNYALETYTYQGNEYYRAKQGGGLPFKIDHLSKIISDMIKLRKYNDAYSMKGIMYMMLMITHYIVDAHVPMHCDLRDDSPKNYTPQNGTYYNDKYHGKLEGEWDYATTEYAIKQGSLAPERADAFTDVKDNEDLCTAVGFDLRQPDHIKAIKVYDIPNNQLMSFIINVCIKSKERNLKIFPIGHTKPDMDFFKEETRPVYADCIGNIISIWLYIWNN